MGLIFASHADRLAREHYLFKCQLAVQSGDIDKAMLLDVWQNHGGATHVGLYSNPLTVDPTGIVFRRLEELEGRHNRREFDIDLFEDIFGSLKSITRLIPGTSHFRRFGEIHPDDLETLLGFDQLCRSLIPDPRVVQQPFFEGDFSGTLICAGSPLSNLTSRIAMGYELKSVNPADGLIRRKDAVLQLAFQPIHDAEYCLTHFGTIGRQLGNSTHKVPNWSIIDVRNDEVFIPNAEHGKLQSDYLLISVLPNILDRDAYEQDDSIIVFGGTHGIGTKAAPLFLRDTRLLSRLANQIGTRFWQALIRVDAIGLTNDRLAPTVLSPKISYAPVNIDDGLLAKWLEDLPHLRQAMATGTKFESNNSSSKKPHTETRASRHSRLGRERPLLKEGTIVPKTPSDGLPLGIVASEIGKAIEFISNDEPEVLVSFFDAYECRKNDKLLPESWPDIGLSNALSAVLINSPRLAYREERMLRIKQGAERSVSPSALGAIRESLEYLVQNEPHVLEAARDTRERLHTSYVKLMRSSMLEYFGTRYSVPIS